MVIKGMLGAREAGDVAADLHQFSGRFNKENTLSFLTAFAAAEGFTPHCHDPPSHCSGWGTERCLQARGP